MIGAGYPIDAYPGDAIIRSSDSSRCFREELKACRVIYWQQNHLFSVDSCDEEKLCRDLQQLEPGDMDMYIVRQIVFCDARL